MNHGEYIKKLGIETARSSSYIQTSRLVFPQYVPPPPPVPEDDDEDGKKTNEVEVDLDEEFAAVLDTATEDEIVDLAGESHRPLDHTELFRNR